MDSFPGTSPYRDPSDAFFHARLSLPGRPPPRSPLVSPMMHLRHSHHLASAESLVAGVSSKVERNIR